MCVAISRCEMYFHHRT